MKTLIISGREDHRQLADACAYDAEDVFATSLEADIFSSTTPAEHLEDRYDLAIIVGIKLSRIDELLIRLLPRVRHRIDGPILGYLFGAYASGLSSNPLKRRFGRRRTRFGALDRLYLGMKEHGDVLADGLGVDTHYVPMAANVLDVAAMPYTSRIERPISLNAFGRQKGDVMHAICDRLNRADSPELAYYPNLLAVGEVHDLRRYRSMFWQLLRRSRLSAAFDHFFANNGHAELSHVGPRWYESLAAGTVVVGRAPNTDECARLLDWEDATIELSSDPATATEELLALLADDVRIQRASRESLIQMSLRHDWAHRLAEMLSVEGIAHPANLSRRLSLLSKNAELLNKKSVSAAVA